MKSRKMSIHLVILAGLLMTVSLKSQENYEEMGQQQFVQKPLTDAQKIKTGDWEDALMVYYDLEQKQIKEPKYGQRLTMIRNGLQGKGFVKRYKREVGNGRQTFDPVAVEQAIETIGMNVPGFIKKYGSKATVRSNGENQQIDDRAVLNILNMVDTAYAKELGFVDTNAVATEEAHGMNAGQETEAPHDAGQGGDDEEQQGAYFDHNDDDLVVRQLNTLVADLSKKEDNRILEKTLSEIKKMVVSETWAEALEAYDAVVSSANLGKELRDDIIAGFNGKGTNYKRVIDAQKNVYPFDVENVAQQIKNLYQSNKKITDPIAHFIAHYTDPNLETSITNAIAAADTKKKVTSAIQEGAVVKGSKIIALMDKQFSEKLVAMNKRLQEVVIARTEVLNANKPQQSTAPAQTQAQAQPQTQQAPQQPAQPVDQPQAQTQQAPQQPAQPDKPAAPAQPAAQPTELDIQEEEEEEEEGGAPAQQPAAAPVAKLNPLIPDSKIAFVNNDKIELLKPMIDALKTGTWIHALQTYNSIKNPSKLFSGKEYQPLLDEIRAGVAGQRGRFMRTADPKFDPQAVEMQIVAMGNGTNITPFLRDYANTRTCENDVEQLIENKEQKKTLQDKLTELNKAIAIIELLDKPTADALKEIQKTLDAAIEKR